MVSGESTGGVKLTIGGVKLPMVERVERVERLERVCGEGVERFEPTGGVKLPNGCGDPVGIAGGEGNPPIGEGEGKICPPILGEGNICPPWSGPPVLIGDIWERR